MSFLAPDRLWLLVVPLAGVGAYIWSLRRHQRYAVRFSNVALLDKVAPDRPGWRRHLPVLATLIAIGSLVLALGRPVLAVTVPRDSATMVLAIDVSLSMDAADVGPTRIAAAKSAARNFVELAPEGLRIGIVAFAGVALAVSPPTTERSATLAAIDRLTLAEGTAVGEGIFAAMDLLDLTENAAADGDGADHIVVLSDGESTGGRPERDAAQQASARNTPVSTIAFGTAAGSIDLQGDVIPVPVNEGALREVAETSGGRFAEAATIDELAEILDAVGSEVAVETEEREVWEWFLGAGVLLLVLGAMGSLIWFSRIP